LQAVSPLPQVAAQTPTLHTWPVAQVLPQAPQWALLCCRLTQSAPQRVSSAPQSALPSGGAPSGVAPSPLVPSSGAMSAPPRSLTAASGLPKTERPSQAPSARAQRGSAHRLQIIQVFLCFKAFTSGHTLATVVPGDRPAAFLAPGVPGRDDD
jgi:hypothetical protein